MGVARPLALACLFLAVSAQAKEAASFRRQVGAAEVDWSAGTLTAQAGAAADPRMPNANAARPGAERRARAAAEAKLLPALRELGQGKTVDEKAALGRAVVSRIEYQSNGGVVLWLTVHFSDLVAARPAPVALRVASMPLSFAPVVAAGDKTATLGFATYRPAASCPKDAPSARRDSRGRLVLAGDTAKLVDSLAGTAVVIYLEKPQP
jgi:hypothetical protein